MIATMMISVSQDVMMLVYIEDLARSRSVRGEYIYYIYYSMYYILLLLLLYYYLVYIEDFARCRSVRGEYRGRCPGLNILFAHISECHFQNLSIRLNILFAARISECHFHYTLPPEVAINLNTTIHGHIFCLLNLYRRRVIQPRHFY